MPYSSLFTWAYPCFSSLSTFALNLMVCWLHPRPLGWWPIQSQLDSYLPSRRRASLPCIWLFLNLLTLPTSPLTSSLCMCAYFPICIFCPFLSSSYKCLAMCSKCASMVPLMAPLFPCRSSLLVAQSALGCEFQAWGLAWYFMVLQYHEYHH